VNRWKGVADDSFRVASNAPGFENQKSFSAQQAPRSDPRSVDRSFYQKNITVRTGEELLDLRQAHGF
jgi:hypothetical protein